MSLSKMEIMMEVMQERMREMQREMKAMEDRNETLRIQQKEEMKTMERKYEERIEDLEKKCPSTLIQSEMKFENGRLWRECERISSVYDNCFIKLATKNANAPSRFGATPEFVKISITEIYLLCADYANIDFSQLESFYKLITFEIDFNIEDQLSLGACSSSPRSGPTPQNFGLYENNSVKKFVCKNCQLSALPSFPNLKELYLYNVVFQSGISGFLKWLELKCPILSKIYIKTRLPCSQSELEHYCVEKGITLKIE